MDVNTQHYRQQQPPLPLTLAHPAAPATTGIASQGHLRPKSTGPPLSLQEVVHYDTSFYENADKESLERAVYNLSAQVNRLKLVRENSSPSAASFRPSAAATSGDEASSGGATGASESGNNTGKATGRNMSCAYCNVVLEDVSSPIPQGYVRGIGYSCMKCDAQLNGTENAQGPILDIKDGKSTNRHSAHEFDDSSSVASSRHTSDVHNIKSQSGSGAASIVGVIPSNGSNNNMACEVCREPLGNEYISAHGRRFHVSHFVCHLCQIPLYALGGYFRDPDSGKRFYCQRDYLQRFSPRCQSCNLPITTGEMTIALGLKYHVECFVCTICRAPFDDDICYEREGKPLCEWHWHVQNGTLCAECGKSIHSRCVITRNKKYHVECAESLYNTKAIKPDLARKRQSVAPPKH